MTAFAVTHLSQPAVPPPEPPPGSVIAWQVQYTGDGPVYHYAAVHVPFRGWYVSDDSETPYRWPELVYWRIGVAPVFVATNWAVLA